MTSTESRDIRDLTPFLQRVFFNMRAWYEKHFAGRTLILTCTWRDRARQGWYYASGRTRPGKILTMIDGIKKLSMHNYRPARAFDFAVKMPDGRVTWNPKMYNSVWAFFRDARLTDKICWGRDFKNFKDFPHIQENV